MSALDEILDAVRVPLDASWETRKLATEELAALRETQDRDRNATHAMREMAQDGQRWKAEAMRLRAEIDAWHTFAARLAEHLHGWDKSFPVPSEPDEQASYRCSLLVRADVVCAKQARMSHALVRLRDDPFVLDGVREIAREALGQ